MGNESGELGFGGHTCQVGTEKQRHVECGYLGMIKNMSNKYKV